MIIQHMESQNGNKPDLNHLKAKLNRQRIIIMKRIAFLSAPKARKGQKFTIDEYVIILKHALGPEIPKEANEIIKLCCGTKSWKCLEIKLKRSSKYIAHAQSGVIHSTILAHLSGTLHLDWRRNFFQFIIDKKYVSITDIDWNVVKETWPSIPKHSFFAATISFVQSHGKSGVPLYQNISENMHHMKNCKKTSQLKLDLINRFENFRNKE